MNRDYLTVADILGMHAILIEKYGGMAGIRDMGGLESAAYRPQSGYYSDIVEEACALMESLLITTLLWMGTNEQLSQPAQSSCV